MVVDIIPNMELVHRTTFPKCFIVLTILWESPAIGLLLIQATVIVLTIVWYSRAIGLLLIQATVIVLTILW